MARNPPFFLNKPFTVPCIYPGVPEIKVFPSRLRSNYFRGAVTAPAGPLPGGFGSQRGLRTQSQCISSEKDSKNTQIKPVTTNRQQAV
jgi:hypothetical protein